MSCAVHHPELAMRAATRPCSCGAGKPARDTGSSQEQQYVKAVIELHDKYLQVLALGLNITTCNHGASAANVVSCMTGM